MASPKNTGAAVWVLNRLLADASKAEAVVLKALQSVPIASAAITVKNSGLELKADARNVSMLENLPFQARQFVDALREVIANDRPGGTVPSWITPAIMLQSTLKGKCEQWPQLHAHPNSVSRSAVSWSHTLHRCQVYREERLEEVGCTQSCGMQRYHPN